MSRLQNTPRTLPAIHLKEGDETARLEELARYHVLDTPPEPVFDDLTRLAARLCGTSMALLSLVDRHRHWFKSIKGFTDIPEIPRSGTFCDHTIWQDNLLVVPDAALDERFADCAVVRGEPHVRFYAGVPLRTPAGHAIGTFCVLGRRPRRLDARQRDSLCTLARQALAQLELKRTIHELHHTATERKAAERERERLVGKLREALAQVKTLSGFLPICASCKNIRDDAGYWQGIETYLSEHADVEFTHGICPACVAKLYPEFIASHRDVKTH